MDVMQPNPARPPPRMIAVASGKGGVGKTWFAITLAHALARAGPGACCCSTAISASPMSTSSLA